MGEWCSRWGGGALGGGWCSMWGIGALDGGGVGLGAVINWTKFHSAICDQFN